MRSTPEPASVAPCTASTLAAPGWTLTAPPVPTNGNVAPVGVTGTEPRKR